MLHRTRNIDALLHICPAHINCEGMSPPIGMIGSTGMPEPRIKEENRAGPCDNAFCLPVKLVFGRRIRPSLRVWQKPGCTIFSREIVKQNGGSYIGDIARYNPRAIDMNSSRIVLTSRRH